MQLPAIVGFSVIPSEGRVNEAGRARARGDSLRFRRVRLWVGILQTTSMLLDLIGATNLGQWTSFHFHLEC